MCFVNLVDEIDNIFEVEYTVYCKNLNKILELEKSNKYLVYKKIKNRYYYDDQTIENKMMIFGTNSHDEVIYKEFKDRYIDSIFKLNNYENIVLIFLAKPLLNLMIFDYKYNQVNTIIELINPFIPFKEFYDWRPYIYEIKELNDNKIIFYGSQRTKESFYLDFKKYDFKFIFNYENLKIEMAENIYYYDDYIWEV